VQNNLSLIKTQNQIINRYKIYQTFWRMLDFIYPPVCAGCGKPGVAFCENCLRKTVPIKDPVCKICGKSILQPGICSSCKSNPPPYTALRSWAEFDDPLREALHSLKYKSNLGVVEIFVDKLTTMVAQNDWNFDIIVPVPTSKMHERERGYNQAKMIALPLSWKLHIPLADNVVTRIKATESQIHLSNEERFKNLEGAFSANSAKLKTKKVLLVDDIVTTGATMISCSKTLLEAGCSSIYCVTVAQTIKKYHKTL
jgi:competence protein ComFC